MRDREGQRIGVGDIVQVHRYVGDAYTGTVVRLGEAFVYVDIPLIWETPGGMLPENVTVIESVDIDIGL